MYGTCNSNIREEFISTQVGYFMKKKKKLNYRGIILKIQKNKKKNSKNIELG